MERSSVRGVSMGERAEEQGAGPEGIKQGGVLFFLGVPCPSGAVLREVPSGTSSSTAPRDMTSLVRKCATLWDSSDAPAAPCCPSSEEGWGGPTATHQFLPTRGFPTK